MLADMKQYSQRPTNIYHNDYFLEKNGYRHLPYHFLVCNGAKNRWQVTMGAPLSYKSHLLALADFNGLIPNIVLDSIVIAYQDDFSLNNPDPTMWEMIAYKICQPIFYLMGKKNDFNNSIHFFDEIFDFDKYAEYLQSGDVGGKPNGRLSNNNYPYQVTESKYFDRIIMDSVMKKYW